MADDPKDKLRQLLEQRDAKTNQREKERNEANEKDIAAGKVFSDLCKTVIEPTVNSLTSEMLTPRGIRVETEKVDGGRSITFFVFNKGVKEPADYELPKTPRLEFSINARPIVLVQAYLGALPAHAVHSGPAAGGESFPRADYGGVRDGTLCQARRDVPSAGVLKMREAKALDMIHATLAAAVHVKPLEPGLADDEIRTALQRATPALGAGAVGDAFEKLVAHRRDASHRLVASRDSLDGILYPNVRVPEEIRPTEAFSALHRGVQ